MSARRRRLVLVGLIASASLALPWIMRRSPDPFPLTASRALAPHTLRRGNGPEPDSLDIHRARSESALTILRDLYEGLTAIGPAGTPILAAADLYDLSPDGRIYRFHLRADARWSNGEPVVAEDFAAAWRRLVDPRTGAQYADILSAVSDATAIIKGIEAPASLGVHAQGARVLIIELDHPVPYFLDVLAHPATFPINRTALAAHGARFAKPGRLVSNGAFSMTRWDFGSHLVASRNPLYWNDNETEFDVVEYYSFADPATELTAFRTGEVDTTTTIPAAQFNWVKAHLGNQLHIAPQLAVYFLGLNLKMPPLNSVAVRRALAMVIDREQLVASVTGTGEAPAYSLVPPTVRGYFPAMPGYAGKPMSERIAAARELLAAQGMAQHPPGLELRYNTSELHSRIAVAVARMWKDALGIDTKLVGEEFKVLLQDIDQGDITQVFRASWVADYDDAYSFLQILRTGFGINLPHYTNSEYDRLLAQATEESDVSRRGELLSHAEAVMLVDQPLIPLYFYVSKHLVSTRILGWRDNPLNVVYSKELRSR